MIRWMVTDMSRAVGGPAHMARPMVALRWFLKILTAVTVFDSLTCLYEIAAVWMDTHIRILKRIPWGLTVESRLPVIQFRIASSDLARNLSLLH